ncbi:hypothetical protein WJX79_009707 [Trebouxia sp. C0005]
MGDVPAQSFEAEVLSSVTDAAAEVAETTPSETMEMLAAASPEAAQIDVEVTQVAAESVNSLSEADTETPRTGEEVLAEGLVPSDANGSADDVLTSQPAAAEDPAASIESPLLADNTEGGQAQNADPALVSTSQASDNAQLDPNSTAALIQARVPTPAREAQEATSSRPSSQEIASQIEGFEDDFKAPEADVLNLASVLEEQEGEGEPDVEELEETIEALKQQKRMLAERNASLQNKVHQHLEARNKGRLVSPPSRDSRQGLDVAYLSALTTSAKLAEEEQRIRNHFLSQTMSLKATLEEKLKKSEELRSTFHHFLTEVAKAAENSKTGRPIPHKVLSDYTKHEAIKDAELQKVRLRHLMLKAQLAKIEHRVKQKEELAEGLHLIDFEQLKIENQSLNEKIEERNEELAKLRKKTATTVQILTHVKEKLQFAQKEKEGMQVELDSVEAALATHRDDLTRVKLVRDKAIVATRKLRDAGSQVTNTALLADLEICKDKKTMLVESMDKVKLSYSQLTAQTAELTQQVLHMTTHVRSQVEASDMAAQQAGLDILGADRAQNHMLNSRANTASTASRPRTVNPALSRSKAVSRSHISDARDPQVEYIPALKLE